MRAAWANSYVYSLFEAVYQGPDWQQPSSELSDGWQMSWGDEAPESTRKMKEPGYSGDSIRSVPSYMAAKMAGLTGCRAPSMAKFKHNGALWVRSRVN